MNTKNKNVLNILIHWYAIGNHQIKYFPNSIWLAIVFDKYQ